MRALRTAAALLLGVVPLCGCYSTVSAPAAATATHTDEVWYVRGRYFLFVRVGSDVYYCPPAQMVSQKVCTRAVMHEDE